MKVSKIFTSSFAIDADLEKELLSKQSKDVSVSKEYLPLGKFNVTVTKEVQKGLLFKKTSFDKLQNYFYVDLNSADLYYLKRTGGLFGQPTLEKSGLVKKMSEFKNEVISTMGQLYSVGSIPQDDLDRSIVQFLASEAMVEIYEPDANQMTNFFRYYLADDVIMRKHFVRPTFHIPNFGNNRYNIDTHMEVLDTVDDDYKKVPIKQSHERLFEVLGNLFGGKVNIREVTYLPVITVSSKDIKEKKLRRERIFPICERGSKKVKHGFDGEEKLEPISFMTEMGVSGSVPIEASTINFASVANMEAVKETIKQKIIYPLTQPKIAKTYGKQAGGSILFYGPPGCGKTYIVRATVGECGINFFNINTSDVMSGGSETAAKNIHEAFSRASKNTPCILFFDEIDALGGRREDVSGDTRLAVNQFLMEMDGVESLSNDVLIIGSTNAPWALDPALRRAGRFTDQIFIPPPEADARSEIFKIHTRKRPVSPEVNYVKLGELTNGYSSADLKAMCDDALEIPWEESLAGKPLRQADMKDFLSVVNTRKSSLTAWYKIAEKEIKKSGEIELYDELASFILTHAGGVDIAVKPDLTFKDVANLKETKDKISRSIIYPLKKPELAQKFGQEVGGGILLYGPPGCGKTYVAKATAGECDAAFFNVKITDIISPEAGESEKRLHAIFERAAKNTPSILFFDEIDALAGRRETGMGASKRLVNQFLTEMDGFKSIKGVMIIGSTNAPWDVDPAIRRSGRLTDQVYVPTPTIESRARIFEIHTEGRPVDGTLDYKKLAELTEGYSSADIKAICDHALEIPWEEAYHGGSERKANMDDFILTIKERTSSLPPWYVLAEKQVNDSGEKDLYTDLITDINNHRHLMVDDSELKEKVKAERDLISSSEIEAKKEKFKSLELARSKLRDAIEIARAEKKKGTFTEEEYKKLIIDYQKKLIDLEIELKYLK